MQRKEPFAQRRAIHAAGHHESVASGSFLASHLAMLAPSATGR
jgi:hypothetical protein